KGKTHTVPLTVNGDLPQRRPYFQDVAKQVANVAISPNGVRALFEAHGDILSVPTKHGSIVNLTHSPGAMDRDPAWSPDGKSVAYFSDRDGEYDLYIRPQAGGSARKVTLGQNDAYYYDLTWSPDSQKVLFSDQKDQLRVVNIKTRNPTPVKVATNSFSSQFDAGWSPDSRWIAYTESLPNYMDAVFIYSLADGKTHQVTDGASDCGSPRFDPNGKYLYFLSSTNSGPTHDFDLASFGRPVTSHVYAMTLEPGTASPIAPEAGFEKPGSDKSDKSGSKKSKSKQPPKVAVDFQGLNSRVVALPVKPANYGELTVGKSGELFLQKSPRVILESDQTPFGVPVSIEQFSLKSKKTKDVIDGVTNFELAANGEKMLYQQGPHWFIADAKPKAKPTQLDIKNMRVFVVPHRQWDQMYREAWRIQRAFFYNPLFDGLNINAAEKEFAHYLPGIASRDGLSFLFREMMSYMSVGHMFIYGGYTPKMQDIHVGLLGANYKIEHDHYRISKIFTAGQWNPHLYAPLAQPGLKIKTGDYLLAVNGTPITGADNIYKAFEDLANQDVTLTVGPNPDMKGSHQITVKTIPSEFKLRNMAWIDHNMAVVNKLSDGKLGYVYLPDTEWGGLTNFNRYFFSQVNKQGVIIDERFNHGGSLSDYIIRYLQRKPMALGVVRWGKQTTTVIPQMQIPGPKVMIINQYAGSGGDALPWYFKMDKVGTLVGERTWGGLVGIGGYPELMDGGGITSPRTGVEGLHGTFPVENHGIAPDVTVWQNPQLMREGHDPQLEKAVEIALKQLKANPPPHYTRPPWRNYHPKLPPLPTPARNGG
ncbi:MAG: S41 family peptidase, partial [Gammaproteobacteria bacterium]